MRTITLHIIPRIKLDNETYKEKAGIHTIIEKDGFLNDVNQGLLRAKFAGFEHVYLYGDFFNAKDVQFLLENVLPNHNIDELTSQVELKGINKVQVTVPFLPSYMLESP